MPQLNQPASYLGEFAQAIALAFILLVLVCFFIVPGTLSARAACMVSSTSVRKSPLEQFAVPIAGTIGATSSLGAAMQMLKLNMIGVYALVSLLALTPWIIGSLSNTLQIERAWGTLVLNAAQDTVRSIVGSALNVLGWFGLVYALLLLLAITNLQGNIPGGYTMATSVVFAGALSISFWVWVTAESLTLQGFQFWGSFVPSGTPLLLVPILVPIEAVSYTARAFSLGVRLFSNMLAGHTLLAILANFMLIGLNSTWVVCLLSTALLGLYTALILLEIAVSLIQAYVFSVLAVSYLEGATG